MKKRVERVRTFLCVFILILAATGKAQTQTVGTFTNSEYALEGYTLVFSFSSNGVYLVDNCGLKIHEWQTENTTVSAYLDDNGDLIKTSPDPNHVFGANGQHGIISRFGWDGEKQWEYKLSTDSLILHHDIELLPNGNILCMAWQRLSRQKTIALGRDTTLAASTADVWDEVILELMPMGPSQASVVWKWTASEHLIQDFDSTKSNYGIVADHPELLNVNYRSQGLGNYDDWLHFNSIDYNAALDQILISGHTFCEIYIIDHSTTSAQAQGHSGGAAGAGGDILYRWGNPHAYKNGTLANQRFDGQHDPTWIAYGDYENDIIVFNNIHSSGVSSVDILSPTWTGSYYLKDVQKRFLPKELAYSFTKTTPTDFFSPGQSSAEVLPNGNIFTLEAAKGKYTEFIPDTKEIVWEYISPIKDNSFTKQGQTASGNPVFKGHKYATDFIGFIDKNINMGLPLEIDPWPTACNGIDTTTHQDTTHQDTTDQDTTVKDSSRLSLNHVELEIQTTVYPNPTSGKCTIKGGQYFQAIEVRDLLGRTVYQSNVVSSSHQIVIDLSKNPPGTYYAICDYGGFPVIKKCILITEQNNY
ncbi:MAG: aryl-sulfate sulfotransferase [Bacteroidia bacterium]